MNDIEIVYDKEIKLEGRGRISSRTTADGRPYHFAFLNNEEEGKDVPAFIWQEDFENLDYEIQTKIEELVQSQKFAYFTVNGFYREGRKGYNTPSFTIKKIESVEEIDEDSDGGEQVIF